MRVRRAARPRRARGRARALTFACVTLAGVALAALWFGVGKRGPAQEPAAPLSAEATRTSSVTSATPEPAPAAPSRPATTTEPSGPVAIGTSVQGRRITAERFGAGERRVLIVGGVHGDEYGVDIAGALAEQLRNHPELVPASVEIHVIECLNPDGRAAGVRGNANKVDLNLNMPAANWKHDLNPQTAAYQHGLNGGSGPGSEPESKVLIRYLEKRFALVVSLHSSGGVIDWNGDGEGIARMMAKVSGLRAEHLPVQPYATGTMGQYVPEAWSIPVITIELASRRLDRPLQDAILAAAAGSQMAP